MPADSLRNIAQRAAARFHAGIESIGDLPWDLVRPIIIRIESPERLYNIEQASPQIIGLDEECWLAFMKRDIPSYQSRPHRPNDPKNWYKAYRKLKREADAEMASGTERLRAAFASIKEEKDQNLAKLTTKISMPATRRANAGWTGRGHFAPSTRNMSASDRIKREQQDAQRARMLRERNQIKLGKQMKQAPTNNPTKVAVAPRSMVEEMKKRNASPPHEPPVQAVRVPIRRPAGSRPPLHAPKETERRRPREAGDGYDLIQDREARLRALQTKKIANEPAPRADAGDTGGLSLDFLEEDDLFSDGDHDKPPTNAPQPSKPAHLRPTPDNSGRAVSPEPRLASPRSMPAKRKAPPSLFMSSPAKKARPGVM